MGNSASLSPWRRTYEIIKQTHDAAYNAIESAITLEEQEKPHEAIEKYKEGILLIDKALDTQVTCPENPDFTWERASLMIQKMKKTRAEVIMRINSITSVPSFVPKEPPPSYEEATQCCGEIPRTYTDLAEALNDLQVETTNAPVEIIYTHDNVQLYFISPDGSVTKASEGKTLNIAAISGEKVSQRRIFLEIGDWVYPLVPGVSPCYRTEYGAFILPDLQSDVPGASIGIILPSDADASVYELLENILHGIIGQSTSLEPHSRTRRDVSVPDQPSAGFSGSIANGLTTSAYYISQGLISGAHKLSSFISYGTPKIINTITPATEAAAVPPSVIKGFAIASTATGTAAQFTGYFADRVASATQALGRYLAPHVQTQGTRLLTSAFNLPEEDVASKVNGVLTVAAGAVEGLSTVYQGLATSATILGSNLSNNTVKIVEHKYGVPAGNLASNTFSTVGNVMNIGHNSGLFTPKGFAKSAAKQTGKAIVKDAKNAARLRPSQLTLYPNLQTAQLGNSSIPPKTN